jgi:hypothetical protein
VAGTPGGYEGAGVTGAADGLAEGAALATGVATGLATAAAEALGEAVVVPLPHAARRTAGMSRSVASVSRRGLMVIRSLAGDRTGSTPPGRMRPGLPVLAAKSILSP